MYWTDSNKKLIKVKSKLKQINNITIIGLGLLGGSIALALKEKTKATIFGIDNKPEHLQQALSLGIIDKASKLSEIQKSDVIVLAIPVDKIPELAFKVLNNIQQDTLVFDVGSTKHKICKTISKHPNRSNYVAAHPIAGTEFSGPKAAFSTLFKNKKNIICDAELTAPDILKKALQLFELLDMQTDFMESASHDKHIAYVSHLSHISSFMLGKTVMEIEKDEKNIFNMAGSGFESTVRLAKSSPETWTPIFIENKESILKSLEEYIRNLTIFKEAINNDNSKQVFQIMKETNYIKKILK
jgi:prephenate dehydrogenase